MIATNETRVRSVWPGAVIRTRVVGGKQQYRIEDQYANTLKNRNLSEWCPTKEEAWESATNTLQDEQG